MNTIFKVAAATLTLGQALGSGYDPSLNSNGIARDPGCALPGPDGRCHSLFKHWQWEGDAGKLKASGVKAAALKSRKGFENRNDAMVSSYDPTERSPDCALPGPDGKCHSSFRHRQWSGIDGKLDGESGFFNRNDAMVSSYDPTERSPDCALPGPDGKCHSSFRHRQWSGIDGKPDAPSSAAWTGQRLRSPKFTNYY